MQDEPNPDITYGESDTKGRCGASRQPVADEVITEACDKGQRSVPLHPIAAVYATVHREDLSDVIQ